MTDNIISAKNLVFTYENQEETLAEKIPAALKGVSIDIKRGSFCAIIGHNGSGKSTLAKLLSGVFKATDGQVEIYPKGAPRPLLASKEEDNFEIRKCVGMVFQNPDNQLVSTIVEDDVAFAPENLGIESSEIRKIVDKSLCDVGLSEYALHDTHKLSGGQKQRVAIAGILAMNPECIIFDESTAMLDPRGRRDVMDIILNLRNKGITVVLITHYMNEAAMADEIFVINDGKMLTSGTPTEVFSRHDLLKSASLEEPGARLLCEKIKSLGVDIDTGCVIDEDSAVDAIKCLFDKKAGGKNA